MRKAWLGVLTLGVVGLWGPGCSGAEFSGAAEPGGSDAGGEPNDVNGGAGASSAGSSSRAGEGGVVSGEGGTAPGDSGAGGVGGSAVPPVECTADQLPADVAGDCKQWQCVSGELTHAVDLKDLPKARGACDAPACSEAGPALRADDSKCAINQHCVEGSCACSACPNGKIANVVADTCILPMGVTAVSNKNNTGSTAAGAIDGTTAKTWNSGTTDGTLTLTFATPQAMTALVVYVTGQADGGSTAARTITVNASIDTGAASPLAANGTWNYASMATGPIRLELGLVKASKITLKLSSPSSWIAVNEVLFVLCS